MNTGDVIFKTIFRFLTHPLPESYSIYISGLKNTTKGRVAFCTSRQCVRMASFFKSGKLISCSAAPAHMTVSKF